MDLKAENNRSLGESARDLLSDDIYTSLKIEVAYVPGFEPNQMALEEMKEFLGSMIHKPEGISIVMSPIESPEDNLFSINEIVDIEKKHRSLYNDEGELTVFIFFANGRSEAEEEGKVILGTAYKNTSMVIFEETIRDMVLSSAYVSRREITSTTLKHEFGHLFGLVDNGSSAQSEHQDSESRAHCNVSGCLMAASVEFGKGAIEHIKSSHIGEFDFQCLRDLRANGGK